MEKSKTRKSKRKAALVPRPDNPDDVQEAFIVDGQLFKVEANPWEVENIEAFHFYCCPECEMKCNTKDQFIDHAMEWHPKAREILHFQMQ